MSASGSDVDSVLVVVSRAGYDVLLRDGVLIEPLRGRRIAYIFSIRTQQLPPPGSFVELHLVELADSDAYVDAMMTAIATRYEVEQIITLAEDEVIPVAVARAVRSLPGLPLAKACLFRDKLLMKAALAGTPVALPPGCRADDDAAIRALFERYGALLAKPRTGLGSKGIVRLADHTDVDHFLARPGAQRQALLVEAFVEGRVHHLDAVVRGGTFRFSSVGRYETAPLEFGVAPWGGTRFSNADVPLHRDARALLMQVLQAYDVDDGVFHLEFFETPTGPVFGEIACRPAGGGIARALLDTFDVHLFEEHVRVQLGWPSRLALEGIRTGYGASVLRLVNVEGVYRGVRGLETLGEWVRHVDFHVAPGQRLVAARHSADSLFNCSLCAASAADLDEALRRLRADVHVDIAAA